MMMPCQCGCGPGLPGNIQLTRYFYGLIIGAVITLTLIPKCMSMAILRAVGATAIFSIQEDAAEDRLSGNCWSGIFNTDENVAPRLL